MSTTAEPQSEELRKKWDRDGALHHVWLALHLDNTADCLAQMEHKDVGLDAEKQAKRVMVFAMCRKFVEVDRDKELENAYTELTHYLVNRGIVKEGGAEVRFLLDAYKLWSEEGTFTFPDGITWHRDS